MTITSEPFNPIIDFVTSRRFLSHNECKRIIELGEKRALKAGKISDSDQSDDIRKCTVSWFDRDPETIWIFDQLEKVIGAVNEKFFHYHIEGFEPLQFTVYNPGDHYVKHLDNQTSSNHPTSRKLSFSIQLSDPDTYTGCNLEFWNHGEFYNPASRDYGSLTIFSSFIPHRVTMLEQGRRYALVGWIFGPQFS